MQTSHDSTLKDSHNDNFETKIDEKDELIKLKKQYDELLSEHDKLKKEYSENIIIESMQDMKQRYERLLQTTIPEHRYNILYEKYTKLIKYFTTTIVLLDHINKSVKEFDKYIYTIENKRHLTKILNEVSITKSILEESIEDILH